MRLSDRGILWLAEGFGSGRLRPGPGTWGSLVGCALSYPLLSLPLGTAVIVTLAAILLAVPVCSRAEVLLGKTDPGSVVLDEIVAIPLTLLPLHAGVLLGAIHPPRVSHHSRHTGFGGWRRSRCSASSTLANPAPSAPSSTSLEVGESSWTTWQQASSRVSFCSGRDGWHPP